MLVCGWPELKISHLWYIFSCNVIEARKYHQKAQVQIFIGLCQENKQGMLTLLSNSSFSKQSEEKNQLMESKASWGGSGGSCHTKTFQDNTAGRPQKGQPKGQRWFSIQGALKK